MSKQFSITSAYQYSPSGNFYDPSVSMNTQHQIVEVHKTQDSSNNLFYMLGNMNGPTYQFITQPISFATGSYPSVGLHPDGDFVIMVYINSSGNILAKCGDADFTNKKVINWDYYSGSAQKMQNNNSAITNATRASVAINPDGIIFIVYSTTSNDLYYIGGVVDQTAMTVTWSDAKKYSTGSRPRVALNNGASFVEVHESTDGSTLLYNLGNVATSNGNTTLTFLKTDTPYQSSSDSWGSSRNPAVAVHESGKVVTLCVSASSNDLYYNTGQIDGSVINFDGATRYLNADPLDSDMSGNTPAICGSYSGLVMSVYRTNSNKLFGSTSQYADRSAWMANYNSKKLSQLCMPGSHDAAMSISQNCTLEGSEGNTRTQKYNIGGQLNRGIRYFDIRPVFEGTGTIYSGHYSQTYATGAQGCDGELMQDILNEVKTFITSATSSKEVVILKFAHFLDNNNVDFFFDGFAESTSTKQTLINQLITMITNSIPAANLYVHSGSTRITENTLYNLTYVSTNNGVAQFTGKVIILFDIAGLSGVTLNSGSVQYINTYLDLVNKTTKTSPSWVMYDVYSHTNSVSKMTSASDSDGQLYRIKQSANHKGDMYLCSWTLTLSLQESANPAGYTILELCQKANGVLAPDMRSAYESNIISGTYFPNIMYVDAADNFVTDVCTWINGLNLK